MQSVGHDPCIHDDGHNEIGAVEPIAEAAKIVKEKNPNTIIHVDAIQAYGKYRICPKKLGIDLLSVSGHKIHAPKGTDFYISKTKQRLNRLFTAADSRKACAPAQRMFLEQRHLERLPWRSTRILMKRLHICMR